MLEIKVNFIVMDKVTLGKIILFHNKNADLFSKYYDFYSISVILKYSCGTLGFIYGLPGFRGTPFVKHLASVMNGFKSYLWLM